MKTTKTHEDLGHIILNDINAHINPSHQIDFNVAVDSLLDLPNHRIYWKDINGEFLGCNNVMAADLGLISTRNIRGLCDYDLPTTKQDANTYRENDKLVLQHNTALEFTETTVNTIDKLRVSYKSIKMPLRDKEHNPIGIIGVTTILHTENLDLPELSPRQKDCLYCLVQGMTIKEISQELNLSPKTIEHYIDAIKAKLHCNNRSSLVKKAFEFTFIKEKFNL